MRLPPHQLHVQVVPCASDLLGQGAEVPMNPFSGLTTLLEWFTELRQHLLTITSLFKEVMRDGAGLGGSRAQELLSRGVAVRHPLRVHVCSHLVLSEPRPIGIYGGFLT